MGFTGLGREIQSENVRSFTSKKRENRVFRDAREEKLSGRLWAGFEGIFAAVSAKLEGQEFPPHPERVKNQVKNPILSLPPGA